MACVMAIVNEHHPISCQSGANLPPIKRKSGWDILSVFPIRGSKFGAADGPLSQEITVILGSRYQNAPPQHARGPHALRGLQ